MCVHPLRVHLLPSSSVHLSLPLWPNRVELCCPPCTGFFHEFVRHFCVDFSDPAQSMNVASVAGAGAQQCEPTAAAVH